MGAGTRSWISVTRLDINVFQWCGNLESQARVISEPLPANSEEEGLMPLTLLQGQLHTTPVWLMTMFSDGLPFSWMRLTWRFGPNVYDCFVTFERCISKPMELDVSDLVMLLVVASGDSLVSIVETVLSRYPESCGCWWDRIFPAQLELQARETVWLQRTPLISWCVYHYPYIRNRNIQVIRPCFTAYTESIVMPCRVADGE